MQLCARVHAKSAQVWNDGVVFIAHHLSAAGLCLLGMRDDSFLLYASYFMGVSEASSAVLSLVACHGRPRPESSR